MRVRNHFFSFLYRLVRYWVHLIISIFQSVFLRSRDLESIVNFGDNYLEKINKRFGHIAFKSDIPKGLEIELFDLKFKSPLISASFKSEEYMLDIWLKLGLGGVTFKTIMSEKRTGNDRPRLQQIKLDRQKALVNSMGLPGMGLESFLPYLEQTKIWNYNRPIGISIGGEDHLEYINNIKKINKSLVKLNRKYFYEINISCPNTDSGLSVGDDLFQFEKLINELETISDVPMGIKISPDWKDSHLQAIADIIKGFDKMFINAGNTRYINLSDASLNKNELPRNGGGLSGGPLLPRTIAIINLLKEFNIPILATGGISDADHVRAAKAAGATFFGMATSLIMDPYCIPRLNRALIQ